ncbi:MAG: hypothetical protein ACRDJU_04570, partial [Actinomycetota bacterium]
MADRGPRTLQTLPSEGIVLEELIGSMREEYGYPATPQEYRLIVRVAPDESERGAARRRAQAGPAPAGVAAPEPEGGPEAEEGTEVAEVTGQEAGAVPG